MVRRQLDTWVKSTPKQQLTTQDQNQHQHPQNYQKSSKKKESRRHRTKQRAVVHTSGEQVVNHQPVWQEVTSSVNQRSSEAPSVQWQLTQLDEMQVPAFSYSQHN